MQQVARTKSVPGRDGAHRRVRSRSASTVTEFW